MLLALQFKFYLAFISSNLVCQILLSFFLICQCNCEDVSEIKNKIKKAKLIIENGNCSTLKIPLPAHNGQKGHRSDNVLEHNGSRSRTIFDNGPNCTKLVGNIHLKEVGNRKWI